MSNPNSEAQRRWRERQKQKRLDTLKQPGARHDSSPFRKPFFEAFQDDGNASSVDIALDCAGIEPALFKDDSGPKSSTGQIEQMAEERGEEAYQGGHNSLGRAEVMVGCLIDAAAELASIINAYKHREIRQRIAEIERADLSDPVARKSALAQIVRLNKLVDQLDKQVRWTFKQWKADEN